MDSDEAHPPAALTDTRKLEVFYWMQLTRTFDERMLLCWKQGRGVGGTFSQIGHEAISVGAAYALGPDDLIAPMHRDLGAQLVRGMSARRIFANLLGRETGPTHGRDANFHGISDLSLNILGFISHLAHSLAVALGAAMSFVYRQEKRVALAFLGDGTTSTGLFHETMNMAALYNAPLVLVLENNQYAYSTPLCQQTKVLDTPSRAASYGMTGIVADGNDVEAIYTVARVAADRARFGGGPTLIEAKTMRMLGHAIHDGAEYVPRELLSEWAARDPLLLFRNKLLFEGVASEQDLVSIVQRCEHEVNDALAFAEASPWPDPSTIQDGVYAN
jgi:TPP-dependent pyruvate/acetoin dehydrogenase alpha subunit